MRFIETREIAAVLLTVPLTIGMHPDDNELFWFRCAIMIDNIEFYILILM